MVSVVEAAEGTYLLKYPTELITTQRLGLCSFLSFLDETLYSLFYAMGLTTHCFTPSCFAFLSYLLQRGDGFSGLAQGVRIYNMI